MKKCLKSLTVHKEKFTYVLKLIKANYCSLEGAQPLNTFNLTRICHSSGSALPKWAPYPSHSCSPPLSGGRHKRQRLQVEIKTIYWTLQWDKKTNSNSNNAKDKNVNKERVIYMQKCSVSPGQEKPMADRPSAHHTFSRIRKKPCSSCYQGKETPSLTSPAMR